MGKKEGKHIEQIKKAKRMKKWYQGWHWDNTVPLAELTPNNSPRKSYPTRNGKPVIRYGFEGK